MEVKQRFEITFEALHISPPELLVLGPGRAAVVRGELHPQLRGGLLAGQLVQEVVTVPELPPQITEAVLVVLDISSDILYIVLELQMKVRGDFTITGLLLVERTFTFKTLLTVKTL